MRIAGEWLTFDDGITRPIVRVRIIRVGGRSHRERFLIDTGADRTVLSAGILSESGIAVEAPPVGSALRGIGGDTAMVLVATTLAFARDDGGAVRMQGRFAGFTNLRATDVSILGRDVLDQFDVIVSRRRDQVLLLTANHRYGVTPS